MKFNTAVLQGTYSQLVNVTEHKHEVNICINGIQTSQLKVASALVITHGEKNQFGMWSYILLYSRYVHFDIAWHS